MSRAAPDTGRPADPAVEDRPARSRSRFRTWSRSRPLRAALLGRRQALAGIAVLAVFVAVAVFGPLLTPYDPHAKTGPVYAPPGGAHLLGTDDGGVDMLSLLIAGTRVSLLVGFAAAVVAMLIGGTVGLTAGFFGGRTDTILMRLTDYVIVIPDVPLMIVIAALFGRSLTNIVLIIGGIYWTFTARVIRAQVKSLRERTYVRRARAVGAGSIRLIGRHVLPQVAPLLTANTVLLISFAIFAETFITFLGLGDPSLVSWGRLIGNAFKGNAVLNQAWWAIVPPGVCVAVVVLACTMVGQSVEDALNPRLRVGHVAVRRFSIRPPSGNPDGGAQDASRGGPDGGSRGGPPQGSQESQGGLDGGDGGSQGGSHSGLDNGSNHRRER